MTDIPGRAVQRRKLPRSQRIALHVSGMLTIAWAALPTFVIAADGQPGVQRSSTVVFVVVILLVASLTAGVFFASPLRRRRRPGDAGSRSEPSGLVPGSDGLPAMPGGHITGNAAVATQPLAAGAATAVSGRIKTEQATPRAWPAQADLPAPVWHPSDGQPPAAMEGVPKASFPDAPSPPAIPLEEEVAKPPEQTPARPLRAWPMNDPQRAARSAWSTDTAQPRKGWTSRG